MAAPKNPQGRAGLGRPKGALNKSTQELKTVASRFAAEAIDVAVAIMRDAGARHSDRLKAIEIVLDRACGRPRQEVEAANPEGEAVPPVFVVLPDNGRSAAAGAVNRVPANVG